MFSASLLLLPLLLAPLSSFAAPSLVARAQAEFIKPGASSNVCLTASSNANNAPVTIEPCNSSTRQQWTLSGGTLSVFGGTKCLDVTNGSTTNGNKMQIYSCASGNKNQQFTTSGTTIKWANHNECLDLTDGNTSDGTVVQMWTCTGGRNQVWNRSPAGPPTTPTTTSTSTRTTSTPPPAATFHFIHPGADHDVCLSASDDANNAAVEIAPCNSSTRQRWVSGPGGTLSVFGGTKCLDVTNGSTANGNKMQVYNCSAGNKNQQFSISGTTIKWANHNECLDLTDGKTASGTVVQMWTCTGGKNQVWNIE